MIERKSERKRTSSALLEQRLAFYWITLSESEEKAEDEERAPEVEECGKILKKELQSRKREDRRLVGWGLNVHLHWQKEIGLAAKYSYRRGLKNNHTMM